MTAKVNLSEYLHPTMDLLFVALNAPTNSNNNGHWFSNNLSFWNLLYRAGVITSPITDKLDGDVTVFGGTSINHNHWTIGVTDLNRRDVETDSTHVEVRPSDVARIMDLLKTHKVSRVCLMHSKVGEAFRNHAVGVSFNANRYGVIAQHNGTTIYEVPFHSGNSIPNKEYYYSLLLGNSKQQEVQEKKVVSTEKNIEKPKPTIAAVQSEGINFTIPKVGNSITEGDVSNGQLRITVDFKNHFPSASQMVKVKYLGKNKEVRFTFRDGKSGVLNVGSEFMSLLSIDTKSRIKVSIVDGKYVLVKV